VANLGVNYADAGRLRAAIPLLEEALTAIKSSRNPDPSDALWISQRLSDAYLGRGQHDKAIPLIEERLRLQKATLGPDHKKTLQSLNELAWSNWKAKRLDRSIPLFEELLPRCEKKFGRGHEHTQLAVANLGVNYSDSGRVAEAIPLLEEAYLASKKHPGLHYPGPYLLNAYVKAEKPVEAARLIDELLSDDRETLAKDGPRLAGRLAQYGLTLLEMKRFAEAEPLLREAMGIREKKQPDAWTTFNTRSMLGGALLGLKKYAEAGPLLRKGYEGMKRREGSIPPPGKARLPEALDRLVELYVATDKPVEVRKYRAERAKYPDLLPPPLVEK
jgi:eukaryotic-like serine/threonine-protein kinase